MEFVKITRNGETKTVEKTSAHIYAQRGWSEEKTENKSARNANSAYTSTSNPYYANNTNN